MFKKINNRSLFKMIMLVFLLSSFPFVSFLFSQEEDYAANYGRVRYLENSVTIVRGADGLKEESSLNAPVFPGDTIATSREGKAELQLADSSIIRMNYGTELKFQTLADLKNLYELSTILKLFDGSIYIQAEHMDDKEKNFQIDTPFASIYLLTDGLYRINVNSEQQTEVFCYRGVAEVVGEYDSVLLRSGKMTFITYKSSPADPRGFNSFYADSFDRWNDERDEFYYQTSRVDEYSNEIPYEVNHYYTELSYYGNWVDTPVYGYVWYPYHVYSGWRPYYNGYWTYGPSGYFWVSYEPWGWAPYHYGRWSWYTGYGWIWIPGRSFCGAWVSWCYGPSYIGWCALDYWNRPAFINLNLYLDLYDFRCWNFVSYRDVSVRNVRHAVLRQNVVEQGLREAVVIRKPPTIKPRELSQNRERFRDQYRKMRARQPEHIKNIDREKWPKHKAHFRDWEKENIPKEHPARAKAIPERAHAADQRKNTQRFEEKREAPKYKTIPEARENRLVHKNIKSDRATEKRSSSDRKIKNLKTYPRTVTDDSRRNKRTPEAKSSYEPTNRARKSQIKSYSRRKTQENIQRTKPYPSSQRRSFPDSGRSEKRTEYQRRSYDHQKPKQYSRTPKYDSSQTWKKMLKNANQPRKTHQVRKAPTRKQTVNKGTTGSKSGSKYRRQSLSPGKSKSSSSQSKSSGRRTRKR